MKAKTDLTLFILIMLALYIFFAVFAGQVLGQDRIQVTVSDVRWDPAKCVLKWKAERAGKKASFRIDYHAGVMTDGKRTFPLSLEEQVVVHDGLHQVLSGYAASSVVWFDRGGKYPERRPEAGVAPMIGGGR